MRNAIVAALVAALVSSTGTYAASRVLITSERQIAPSVLAKLAKLKAKPAAGKFNLEGPAGVAGSPGQSITGPRGEAGQSIEGPEGRASTVPGPRGETGPVSTVPGPRGESIVGPSSVFVVEERITELRELYVGQRLSSAATCPEGSTPIGGGGFRSEPEDIGVITSTGPNEANGWATTIEVTHPPTPAYTGAVEATFVVWANCIR